MIYSYVTYKCYDTVSIIGEADAQLNPKKKIWEQVQVDFSVDNSGLATYKNVEWNVAGKGTCSVPTLRGCTIK